MSKGLKRGKAELKSLDKAVQQSSGRFKRWGASVSGAMGRLKASGGGLTKWIAGLAAATAGVVTLTVAWGKMRSSMADIDALAKTSDKLGVATEKLAGLRHGAELSGVGADKMEMALQRMTRRIAEAAKGSGEAQDALKQLGVDAQALAKLPADQQLSKIADAMAGVTN